MSRLIFCGSGEPVDVLVRVAGERAAVHRVVSSITELTASEGDIALLASDPTEVVDAQAVLALLEDGIHVVTSGVLRADLADLEDACRRGGSVYHRAGLFEFIVEQMLDLVAQGFSTVRHVRITETLARDTSTFELVRSHREESTAIAAARLRGVSTGHVRVETVDGVHRAEVDHHSVLTAEAHWLQGASNTVTYDLEFDATPANMNLRYEYDAAGGDPALAAVANLMLDAAEAVVRQVPGVMQEDPRPRYALDDRVPGSISGQGETSAWLPAWPASLRPRSTRT